ncbi:MAG TPA: hypothetical protein VL527_09860 [Dongiaceae bacterium]|nr:hypothetical protein [Dongiaceae bacterium]
MRIFLCGLALLAGTVAGRAAERSYDFSATPPHQVPAGFASTVTGQGEPGTWQVVSDVVPSPFQTLTPNATQTATHAVAAQVAQDPTDEHFPLLIATNDVYGDFTLNARVKLVSGQKEQMAGIAFRIQNETNYYVVRVSGLGHNFRFYKFVNGIRTAPIGPDVAVTPGWHDIQVRCTGNHIFCSFDGTNTIPMLTDNSFNSGKIGFWTKSDSVSYFTDLRLTYTPRVPPAQAALQEVLQLYPRVVDLKIYAPKTPGDATTLTAVASKDAKEIGTAGQTVHADAYTHQAGYFHKGRGKVTVVQPMRDRNGDIIGAVEVVMDSFFGQTEENAVSRALPIVKALETRLQTAADLTE